MARSKIVKLTQSIMCWVTFYPGDTEYDQVVMQALGKADIVSARDDWPLYTELSQKSQTAARNFRTDTNGRVASTFMENYGRADDLPYDSLKQYNPEFGQQFLAGDCFRNGGTEDYFGSDCYRQILYASNAQLDPDHNELSEMLAHDDIRHMTAPMLAFVQLKVTSLLRGEKSVSDASAGVFNQLLREVNAVDSDFVTVKQPPVNNGAAATPSTSAGGPQNPWPRMQGLGY